LFVLHKQLLIAIMLHINQPKAEKALGR